MGRDRDAHVTRLDQEELRVTVKELMEHLKMYNPEWPVVLAGEIEFGHPSWYKEARDLDAGKFEVWNFGPGGLGTPSENIKVIIG